MTDADLQAIRERCEAATPGPWFGCGDHIDDCSGKPFAQAVGRFADRSHDTFCQNNEFIAHARQDIPALLAEVERLQTENLGLRRLFADEGRRWDEAYLQKMIAEAAARKE